MKNAKNRYVVGVLSKKRLMTFTSSRSRQTSIKLNAVFESLLASTPSNTSGIGLAFTPGPESKNFRVIGG